MKTGILAQQSGKENPTNLLPNGDFESWSAGASEAPDGWTLDVNAGSGTILGDTTAGKVKMGTYSSKIVSGTQDVYLYQEKTDAQNYYRSRKYTAGAWVWCATGSKAKISFSDGGTGSEVSASHSGGSTWEFLTVTLTVSGTATKLRVNLWTVAGATAYWDGVICVEGESAFAYADKPAGEGVWKDYFATSTIVGWQAGQTGSIYTKKIGKTVFVSYAILGTSDSATTTFTLPYTGATGNVYDLGMAWDNGGPYAVGKILLPAGDAVVTLNKDVTGAAFTNSGTKYVFGNFFYESI